MKENKNKPKAFACYLDDITVLEHLTDEEAGKLWKLLYNLAVNDVRGECDDPMVSMAFDLMANKLERDFAAYKKKVRANRENGKKGGAPLGNRNAAKATDDFWDDETKTTETTENKQEEEKEEEKEKDKEEEEEKKTSAKADCAADADDLIILFDRLCPDIPNTCTPPKLRALIPEARSRLGRMGFDEYFSRIAKSDFLTGRNGKWRGCTLEWLLDPKTIEKVLCGVYDDREATRTASYDIEKLEEIDRLEFI